MLFKTKTKWYKAFDSQESADKILKLNQPFYLLLEGKAFCVIKKEKGIFAMDDKCPHQGASLSEGYCSNGEIVCPWHHYQFNIKNGRQAGGGGDYVNTHKVEVRDGAVFFGVERLSFLGF
ncbi:MAG: Rieske (2Fe-2S) protein [Bacteroidetes bacterium]|nr:Rieske (2Fe-2S) protein [Bacteroidota bacterium]